ncbi:hypothetical protein JCM8547_007831 [Rhodosporidiobolus lusitaniae]
MPTVDLAVPPTLPATLSSLPPELLLKILLHACTTARLSGPLLVHDQFTQLETSCRSCVYRNLTGVCKEWREIVREIMGREVVLANGCGSEKKDEEVLALIATDEGRARNVKVVDAGLRRATCGWAGWPVPQNTEASGESQSANVEGGITTRGVELERIREQCLNRERQRLYRLLSHCRLVNTLDVDLGFYPALCSPVTLLPPTIRTLTLRNSEPLETLALIISLPLLEDLTLRLALDWFLPPSTCPHTSVGTCRLRRFELSTTAFGATSLPSILALLVNSHETLASLTLRNKGASPAASQAFLPVARGLVETFAEQLEELTIKDIPRGGRRAPGDEPTSDWFPSRPTSFPRLAHLHLTGVPLPSPSLFSSSLVLPSPSSHHLRTLTIEDFDALSARPLIEALKIVPALRRLEELNVAFARELEMQRLGEGVEEGKVWEREKRELEDWCEGKGREEGRKTALMASWQVIKVTGCGFW